MKKWVRFPTLVLSALLHLAPLMRVAVAESAVASSPILAVLRWFTGAVAVAGAFHGVSGATGLTITQGGTSVSSVTVTNGVQVVGFRMSIVSSIHGTAASYTFKSLPSGLAGSLQGVVTGIPTLSGHFTVTVTGWANSGGKGDNYSTTFPVTVLDAAALTAQTISFGAIPVQTFGDPPLSLSATASSGLPVSFSVVSGPGTVNGNSLSFSGAGTVVVAANQAGNATFSAASTVTQSITVLKAAQTISFGSIPAQFVGGAPLTLSASASSGLPVSFSVVSGPAILNGNSLSLIGAGTVVVAANQLGDANFNGAVEVIQSIQVSAIGQTILFATNPVRTFGDGPVSLSATASSGLPVSFSVVSGPGTVNGNSLSFSGAGTVVVAANQAGNATFSAAPTVTQSITVLKAAQTISFGAISAQSVGGAPLTLSASASSGLPVSFSVVSGPATLNGNSLSFTGAGTVVVAANQAGDANYDAAAPVTQPIQVSATGQTVLFAAIPTQTFGGAPLTLSATSSSGLPVNFSVVSGPGTLNGNSLSLGGAGIVVVAANQAGDAMFSAAPTVTQSITVLKAAQIISFGAIPAQSIGGAPLTLSANASSGLPVSFSVVSGPATLIGNSLSFTGAGTVVVAANQVGDANYNAASEISQSIQVSATGQTILFAAIPTQTFGGVPLTLSASASSGLSVSFSLVSGPATLNGNSLIFTGAGTVIVAANQAGNATFSAAPTVTQSITVLKAAQTISFGAIPAQAVGGAPLKLSASASSGLPVSFSLVSGPASLNGNSLSFSGAGTVVVAANQSGDANYHAAAEVTQSIQVSATAQTIQFAAIPVQTLGGAPLNLSASASSGLAVSFSLVSGPATLNGNSLVFTGSGTVIVAANQAGNATFSAAPTVTQSITVLKAAQTISFAPFDPAGYPIGKPVLLSATSSSGLSVEFSIVSGPGVLIQNQLTPSAAGTIVISATQPGNEQYAAAAPVQRSVVVQGSSLQSQTLNFAALPATIYSAGLTIPLVATASSGLPVSYSVASGPGNVSGTNLVVTGAGRISVTASQPGNSVFSPAESVSNDLIVAKAAQTLTFDTVSTISLGADPLLLTASSSASLPIAFRILNGPGTLQDGQLTLTGIGTLVVAADQPGDGNYLPGPQVSRTITVIPGIVFRTVLPGAAGPGLQLLLDVGVTAQVEETADLGTWTPLSTISGKGPGTLVNFAIPGSPDQNVSKFWRLRVLP